MIEYKKYKWFYTKSGKIVVGGKSAESNDSLLRELKSSRNDYIVMHTKAPGSPFCAILSEIKSVSSSDIEECAIFTGCFSKAWKEQKRETKVDMFHLSQINKGNLKSGSWSVTGKIQSHTIELNLVLVFQEKTIRAVPMQSVLKKEILFYVSPGSLDKSLVVKDKMFENLNSEQLIAALPAGGVSFKKNA
jgi:hypothetical protein